VIALSLRILTLCGVFISSHGRPVIAQKKRKNNPTRLEEDDFISAKGGFESSTSSVCGLEWIGRGN
jgi:hypothetical protein